MNSQLLVCEEWMIWILWILDEFLWAESSELCLKKRWNMVEHLLQVQGAEIIQSPIAQWSANWNILFSWKEAVGFFCQWQASLNFWLCRVASKSSCKCNRRFSCDIINWVRWSVIIASHNDSHDVGCAIHKNNSFYHHHISPSMTLHSHWEPCMGMIQLFENLQFWLHLTKQTSAKNQHAVRKLHARTMISHWSIVIQFNKHVVTLWRLLATLDSASPPPRLALWSPPVTVSIKLHQTS